MFGAIAKKIFGTKNARELKKMQPVVAAIAELEPKMKSKSDADLLAMTADFRRRLDNGAKLDELLPEAFAVVREAGRRVLNMRHFDVQLMGGMALHKGKIAEMKTGEGKTLVATLPLYLNALEGRGCHLVTVNDYLARRDAEWMGRLYKFLGMSTGIVVHGLSDRERQVSYRCDISYGTNSEFGFDYLRDNMKESIERYVQRELHYAIVDEVDSILIDEARTPLIISGPAEESADLYYKVNSIIPSLKKDVDYTVDEKAHSVMTTDQGIERLERLLNVGNLYDPQNIEMLHHVTQALRAHTLYKRDVNYLVEEGKVLIIDEFTGRKMPGRRWSDGLHQAVEAKEGVTVEEENQTLATISYQNYFRMYKKLGGMTGTADTEAAEFHDIYKLDVNVVPTNKPMIRADNADLVYKNERGKFRAVIKEIEELHAKGQPILVGTISVEKSEVLSSMLKKRGIKHSVLNAKNHAKEAEFVAQAGRLGALTISTNMAGRGTDIVLGGNPEFMAKAEFDPDQQPQEYAQALAKYRDQCKAERDQVLTAGGLHILGTERHESRRIDNQLRGRSGRQGDPGSSRFYMSLEDDLLRIFGAERITGLMERLGMEEDVPIEHSLVNRAIENAQKRVEGHNFDIRKNLLEYDDVMNQQRKTIYALRRQILEGRYQPELGEEDKKRGKEPLPPPITSGKWTIESLAETIKEGVARVVDAFNAKTLKPGIDGDGDGGQTSTAPTPEMPRDPQILAHELYRYYGALVDVAKLIDDRDACVAEAAKQCAASLIQQRERILDLADELLQRVIGLYCAKPHAEDWNINELREAIREMFNYNPDLKPESMDHESLAQHLWEQLEHLVEARENDLGPLAFYYFARHFFLEEIDQQWIDHLKSMDHLREGIGLRGYGQKDPKQEYKKEGFDMFVAMMERITQNVSGKLFRVQIVKEQPLPEVKHKRPRKTVESGGDMPEPTVGGGVARSGATAQLQNAAQASAQGPVEKVKTIRRDEPKVGRNDPCPCGSGKKYKKCHGGAQATP